MAQTVNKFHKEYSCNFQAVKKGQDEVKKRYTRNKWIWTLYTALLTVSLLLFSIWITFLILVGGFILFPSSFFQKELVTEKPFLVLDSKYVQFKGKMMSWNTLGSINITQEKLKKKEFPCHFMICFLSLSGKEIKVETAYFEEEEDILKSVLLLAQVKKIPVENKCSISVPVEPSMVSV